MSEDLTPMDKLNIKHLQALRWLESLERDYIANGLVFPTELMVANRCLRFILNELGKRELAKGGAE